MSSINNTETATKTTDVRYFTTRDGSATIGVARGPDHVAIVDNPHSPGTSARVAFPAELAGAVADFMAGREHAAPAPGPVPMIMWCPDCGERHVDEGEFASRPHHTHACQACGVVWRPAVVDTVGVRFLPGFGPAAPAGGDDERAEPGPAAEDADRAWRDRMAAGQDQLLQIAREQAGSLSAIASAARTIAGGADKRTDPDPAAEAPEQPWFRMSWQAGHAIPRLARDLRAIHAAAGRYPVPSWRDASERERNSWYAVALRAAQIAKVASARALDEVDPGGVPPNGSAFNLLPSHVVMLKNEWRKTVDE